MNVHTIDHVEFFVGDARQTAYYFCTAFGFRIVGQAGPETGLAGQRTLHLRHGDIHLLLTSGLTADHPATQYVARHGDGVAVVAFAVDDATASHAEAMARGAANISTPARYGHGTVMAGVSGFGDVTHRLVERCRDDTGFWPDVIRPSASASVSAGEEPERLMEVIDHLAICVPAGQLDETVAYYTEVFGFAEILAEYIEVGGQAMDSKVVQSASGGATFTLIEPDPTRAAGQIDDFLTWHAGAGVQHLAFRSTDILTAVSTFAARGVGFLRSPGSYYDALEGRIGAVELPVPGLREAGILVDRDHAGELYQIFTQSMHVRRTLFLELIERRGALTFGSSNIKALYEAKERELSAGHRRPETVPA
ncbi:MAG TPA: 4-hydroxyphenylpyruvate dioxygenase [Actinoplanes sp.]|nr:4-hydroxyphenylpyruvate dioxygenase [Actinoplanes sp.]